MSPVLNFQIRQISEADVGTLRTLAKACPPLGLHTAFTYWVVSHFYGEYSFMAIDQNNEPAGYVMCITKRDEADLLYVWQIGVLSQYRQQKLAQQLLKCVGQKAKAAGMKRLQVTIDEKNAASNRLFQTFAQENAFEYKTIGDVSYTDPLENYSEAEQLIEIVMA